jgi:hypothetical protein
MLSFHRKRSVHGKKCICSLTIFSGLAFLVLSLNAPGFAQSSAELTATRNWLESRKSDPAIAALLTSTGTDPCASTGGIAFDPLACIESYLKKWLAIQNVAEGDPQASPTVKNTARVIVEGLRNSERQWKSLSPSLRNQQLASRQEIFKEVENSGGDAKRTLEGIGSTRRSSQQTRDIAASLLGSSSRTGPHGGPFCFFTCYCVWQEGCPCCASTIIGDIKTSPF